MAGVADFVGKHSGAKATWQRDPTIVARTGLCLSFDGPGDAEDNMNNYVCCAQAEPVSEIGRRFLDTFRGREDRNAYDRLSDINFVSGLGL
jgi:hypothetical protein